MMLQCIVRVQMVNDVSCLFIYLCSHHPQEVLLAQFSLYVHKGGLKPDSFHFVFTHHTTHLDFSHVVGLPAIHYPFQYLEYLYYFVLFIVADIVLQALHEARPVVNNAGSVINLNYFINTKRPNVFFQFEIIINVFSLHSDTYCIGLWHCACFFSFSAGIDFELQILMSTTWNSNV